MEFARDAHPLADTRIESHCELAPQRAKTNQICHPEQKQDGYYTQRTKPARLIVRGCDGEIEKCAGFIPYAVVV